MKETIELLHRRMEDFFWKIAEEKEDLTIDGVRGYNDKAQFVAGKVINLSCYVVVKSLKGTDRYEEGLKSLSDVIRMVSGMPMETWGILNGITGLRRLQLLGMLDDVVDAETMERLKTSMDWRTFVDVNNNYALINKPTNYYGVAFGIARYRDLLGWEPEGYSQILLNCLMKHIETYSGEYSFMDETRGEGRFDRYSILIPSEVTGLLLAGGMEVPELIRKMLKKSAHIFLSLANENGLGYSYGRSIGAYGETAALEVLSAAAVLDGVLTEDEKKLAYGYSQRLIKTMVHFWYDEEMQSINMWDKGRKTDNYRNKNRILGENLSLSMQIISTLEHWADAGVTSMEEPENWTAMLPGAKVEGELIRFAKGEFDRCLAIVHDGKHVWSLPMISGGKEYFDKDPYLPVPRENLVQEGVPEHNYGAWVPQLMLANGDRVMPICYINEVEDQQEDNCYTVTCRQAKLCVAGKGAPEAVDGVRTETTFRFTPGCVERTDTFVLDGSLDVKEVVLEAQVFSVGAVVGDDVTCGGGVGAGVEAAAGGAGIGVVFAEGPVLAMSGAGYESCETAELAADGEHDTPHGRLNTKVVWKKAVHEAEGTTQVSWSMKVR